jgi:hypothetical protein
MSTNVVHNLRRSGYPLGKSPVLAVDAAWETDRLALRTPGGVFVIDFVLAIGDGLKACDDSSDGVDLLRGCLRIRQQNDRRRTRLRGVLAARTPDSSLSSSPTCCHSSLGFAPRLYHLVTPVEATRCGNSARRPF